MDSSVSLLNISAVAIGFLAILGTLMVCKKFRSNPENKRMASSSSPPLPSPSWPPDVYPSYYRREYIRKECSLVTEAIRGSRVAIVLLSKNYASSSCCLDELVEIMKCRDELGQAVVPVFYELDPTDVRKLTGDFGSLFTITCRGKTTEEIDRWSQALAKLATTTGFHSRSWDSEEDMIEKIATDISNILNKSTPSSSFQGLVGMEAHIYKKMKPTSSLCLDSDEGNMVKEIIANRSNHSVPSSDFENIVGMRAHIKNLEPLLFLDSNEVRTIGIWGPSGIGKTTIAKCIFHQISHQFQLITIMANNQHEHDAKLQLRNQLLSQLINQQDTDDEISHLGVAQEMLKDKKVLLVLDDVDGLGQLDALAEETQWFGPGSRIIITTQDPRLLKAHGIKHIYKVDLPSRDEALQIFCMYGFRQKSPYNGFEKLAREVTTLTGENPLGLRFMGSYLRGKSRKEWKIELIRLRTRVDKKLGSIRDFTYDSLCGEDKKIADCELKAKIDEFIARFHSERRDQMRGVIITNQDAKEDFSTSERDFKGMSNGLLHTVYIYCADTLQYSFASHLSVVLRRKRIATFVNCNRTLDVIQGASAYVVVLSKKYLSSTSCLDKLVTVLQCRRKTGQLVVPVFYGVSPSELAVPEHDSAVRIREWSSALQELRELPSHQSREECSECELVEEIVKDVYEKLFPTEQIGINSRLLEIEHLLCKQLWGIRRIGIWGMPGIGKTTLAKAVFDQIAGGYEASCFIEHFDKAFLEKGFHRLLEEHFGRTLKELPRVCSSITRPSLPGDKLSKKRTLIVLDDVENPLTAESFLGWIHWFGPGSLIIMTSRDKQVFRLCQINHVYEVQSLNKNEALQLFSQCAFGEDIREENLLKLSMEVIDYANGNPLALSFYGRELKGKKLSEMETTFLKLKLRTPYKIHDLLNRSYEKLSDNEKNTFLDIACFFEGEKVDYVMQLLEGCGFFPHVGIDVLVDKCLVTISENCLRMHRIIQDFGRDIINRQTVQIERRRRLWEPWTIKILLEDDKLEANDYPKATYSRALGTEDIEGIFLDTSNLIFDLKPVAFENMLNLRFLKISCSSYENHYGLCLPKGLEYLPYELRLLHWEDYPLRSLPQDFDPSNLVELNMPYSQLQKLWGGTKKLKMLKRARLWHSQQLTEIDDICKAQNVELIDLRGCTKLQCFPATGQLQHLRVVNLSGCTEIRSLPEVSPNIKELHLQGTGIREFPESIVTLFKQAKLNRELSSLVTEFSGVSNTLMNDERLTSLVKVVSSNHQLGKLAFLNMKDCSHLQSLPHMVDLESLQVLHLSGCSQLKDIQSFPKNLKELYLAGTALEELPPLPKSLEVLNAHGCVSLKSIPYGFMQFPSYYTFSDCFILSAQVVSDFVVNALAAVERMPREYKQKKVLNESLAFSFCAPSPANTKSILALQPGSSVMLHLCPSWRSTFLGFFILVEVAFSEDFHMDIDFGVRYVCRWKDKEGISHWVETTLHCWSPEEGVPNIQKDHLFVLCDLNVHPSSGEGKDSDILADLVVFEFFPVNKQEKLVDESCTVKKCGVYVITAADGDTSLNMNQRVSSLDHTKELSDREAEEELIDIYDGLDKKYQNLFYYILCLFNDEETDLVAQRIASIGLDIRSGLEVLADKSLIHISPCGITVPPHLLLKLVSEIVRRSALPSTLPDSLPVLERDFEKVLTTSSLSHNREWDNQTKMAKKNSYDVSDTMTHAPSNDSGDLVGIKDHVADMSSLSNSESKEVKTVVISAPSEKGEEPVEPLHLLSGQGKAFYSLWQKLFESDKYLPTKLIHGGSPWLVCSAINRETGKKVSIKKIHNVFDKRINAVRILREMNLLRQVRHDNIIACSDVILPSHMTSFKDVYMVYEPMDTNLHQIIKSSKLLSDDHCKYYLFQLLQGLKHLHSVNIIHCDLRPENLLVVANSDIKISDFGLARTSLCKDQFVIENAVTHWYRAPELLLECDNYGTSVDIWSVGCIFAEVLGRKPIFPGTETLNQLKQIINVLGSQQESDLQFINNPKHQKYIKSLTSSRGTLLSHLYPQANPLAIDLLQRMLVFNPTKRITITEAVLHPYLAGLFNSKRNPPTRIPNALRIDENMDERTLREMMWKEMLYYHPEAAFQKP